MQRTVTSEARPTRGAAAFLGRLWAPRTVPWWLLVLPLALAACTPKDMVVRINVEARTNQGDPVAAAVVAIDGKSLGETNNVGAFTGEVALPAGAKKRLEVRKESDTYYFAPYYEGFIVGDASPQDQTFAATMYFVPKPTPSGAAPAALPGATGVAASAAPGVTTLASNVGPPSELAAVARGALAAVPPGGSAAVAPGVPATGGSALPATASVPSSGGGVPVASGAVAAAVDATPPTVASGASAPAVVAGHSSPMLAASPPRTPPEATVAAKVRVPAPATAALRPTTSADFAAAAAASDLGAEADNGVDAESGVEAADITADAAGDELGGDSGPPVRGAKLALHLPVLPKTAKHPAAVVVAREAPAPVEDAVPPPAVAPATREKHDSRGPVVFTVHVAAGETPVPDAEVSFGEDGDAGLKVACHTNPRGRCALHFAERPEAPVTFVAAKKGFKTVSMSVPVADKGLLRVNLVPGHTLDIYALTRAYNHTVGLKDVEVFVAGKRVGATDHFGRYSYVYDGKPEDLVAVTLKPVAHLPETFETDFVAAGPMTLVKYFTPAQPPPVRMTVLASEPAGTAAAPGLAGLDAALDEAVRGATRKHLFSSSAFKEFPLAQYERAVRRSGKTAGELRRKGWQETELKSVVDAVLVPTVVLGARPELELSVVDSLGRVLAAAKEDLDGLGDKVAIDRAVAVIAKKITRAFPFEGAVLGKSEGKVTVNLGDSQGRGVKVGDVLDVYGVQAEKLGRSQLHTKVAMLTVRDLADGTATCTVSRLAPRATVERGDLVALRPRKVPDASAAQLRVTTTEPAAAVAQANVYLNDTWLGATDESGRLYFDTAGSGTLKIVKQGYGDFAKPVSISPKTKLDVSLQREAAYLRIDSRPPGATVRVDGRELGKTPLTTPVAVPSGFVKLELTAPGGFKPYSQVLELDQGTLDLTGEAAVALEQDFRAIARQQLKAGRIEEALATLSAIPKEHSDYLLGRHEAGEIYLTRLDQPAKAAEAFAQVTANEAVKQFADKRFIGSHVNEGIALFLTAERLAPTDPEAARAHYEKALAVLDAVVPHLRFVPATEYASAVHNVDYHRALCRHRLSEASQDPRMLAETVKTWRSYLDGSARSVPLDGTSRTYVDNAEVYVRQATASLNAAKTVSRQ